MLIPRAARAPGLIAKLPTKNGRLVQVTSDEGLDVVLVRGL